MVWEKWNFQGVCVGTDVSGGFERQKTCGSLGQNPQTLSIKQQAKDVLYIKYYLAFLFYP